MLPEYTFGIQVTCTHGVELSDARALVVSSAPGKPARFTSNPRQQVTPTPVSAHYQPHSTHNGRFCTYSFLSCYSSG
jgi:hypothetical protein